MQYRTLGSTGLQVSALSYGASSLGSVFRAVNEEEGIRTVHAALDLGINYIDVSPYYGLTKAETLLGQALRTVPRDRYLLSTKAGRYGENQFDFSASRIRSSLDESLLRLGVDYVDLLFLHDIEFVSSDIIFEEAIPTLQALKQEGKIRFSGISGLPLDTFTHILDNAHVDAILSYCHYSLNDTSLLDMLSYLKQKGVSLVNASPLSMGLLNGKPLPEWHPATDQMRLICKRAADHCAERGKDLAKLAVQYSVQDERIPTTLVSTANPDNIAKNAKWLDKPIDQELLSEVLDILQPIHNMSWKSGLPEYNRHIQL
ncbi:MAG: aldo/keto reductase [Gorillibacterium sp.]|nr:aldo/keto reductase [Gorillibacterium sp.]